MSLHCDYYDNIISFTEGKQWKKSKPRRGRAIRYISKAPGCSVVTVMQCKLLFIMCSINANSFMTMMS